LSSNLIKRGTTSVQNDITRVIDVNELIAKRMEYLASQAKSLPPEEILSGEAPEAAEVAALLADEEDAFEALTADREVIETQLTPSETIEAAKEQAKAIVDQANAEAENILQTANQTAQMEANRLREEAKTKGYEEGYQKAIDDLKREQDALALRSRELEEQYNQMLEYAEVQLIDSLSNIYEHVIGVSFQGDSEVLQYVLSQALRGIEGSRSFIVRVSGDVYADIVMKQAVLEQCIPGKDSSLEIIEDSNLESMECRIETENGIFDCGLDAQLRELKKKLVLLSYEKA